MMGDHFSRTKSLIDDVVMWRACWLQEGRPNSASARSGAVGLSPCAVDGSIWLRREKSSCCAQVCVRRHDGKQDHLALMTAASVEGTSNSMLMVGTLIMRTWPMIRAHEDSRILAGAWFAHKLVGAINVL